MSVSPRRSYRSTRWLPDGGASQTSFSAGGTPAAAARSWSPRGRFSNRAWSGGRKCQTPCLGWGHDGGGALVRGADRGRPVLVGPAAVALGCCVVAGDGGGGVAVGAAAAGDGRRGGGGVHPAAGRVVAGRRRPRRRSPRRSAGVVADRAGVPRGERVLRA